MPEKYKYNLKVSQGACRSPFTVDLKPESRPEITKKTVKKSNSPKVRRRSFAEWAKSKEDTAKKLLIFALLIFAFRFFANILRFFYKISYFFGWSILFAARLVYFSIKKLWALIAGTAKGLEAAVFYPLKFINPKKGKNTDIEAGANPDHWEAETVLGLDHIADTVMSLPSHAAGAVKGALPRPKKSLIKPALLFSLFLFALIIPFKGMEFYRDMIGLRGRILGISQDAVNDLAQAAEAAGSMNFTAAAENFERASGNFLTAQKEIGEASALLSVLSLIPSKNIRAASDAADILEAGKLGAEMGAHIAAALDSVSGEEKSIEKTVNSFYFHGQAMSDKAARMEVVLSRIDPDNLPEEYRSKFTRLKESSGLVISSLKNLVDTIEKIRLFLGFEEDKRYLLVFQNNAEIRATGGFIGSYALIDFSNGRIKNLEVPEGGSYDTEGGLASDIIAPKPLWLLNPKWHFWDANWWPDWPSSAEKLMWFYEKSGGPTVDGVISFTPNVVEDLLEAIGPIDMREKYGIDFNSDNFRGITQSFSELKPSEHDAVSGLNGKIASSSAVSDIVPEEKLAEYRDEWAEENKPKKIIGDLFGSLIEQMPGRLDKEMFLKLLEVYRKNTASRNIMLYFKDGVLQKKAVDLGWDGSIRQALQDYLMVVHTNIGGGKSDLLTGDRISHSVEIDSEGYVVDSLKIARTNRASGGEIFSGTANIDWLRVYVPEGSRLIEAGGFEPPDSRQIELPEAGWARDPSLMAEESASADLKSDTLIYEESGKTVFANWVITRPGETSEVYFRYRLPFKVIKENKDEGFLASISKLFNPYKKELFPYSLLVQKQPGSWPARFASYMRADSGLGVKAVYPADIQLNKNSWSYEFDLDKDGFLALILEE